MRISLGSWRGVLRLERWDWAPRRELPRPPECSRSVRPSTSWWEWRLTPAGVAAPVLNGDVYGCHACAGVGADIGADFAAAFCNAGLYITPPPVSPGPNARRLNACATCVVRQLTMCASDTHSPRSDHDVSGALTGHPAAPTGTARITMHACISMRQLEGDRVPGLGRSVTALLVVPDRSLLWHRPLRPVRRPGPGPGPRRMGGGAMHACARGGTGEARTCAAA